MFKKISKGRVRYEVLLMAIVLIFISSCDSANPFMTPSEGAIGEYYEDEYRDDLESVPPQSEQIYPSYLSSPYSNPQSISSYLSSGEEEWYQISISRNRTFVFYTESSINTFGTLYGPDSWTLPRASNDNNSDLSYYANANSFDFGLSSYISSDGTYYLKVEGSGSSESGSYNLYYFYTD